jgi:CheY-like chemotaxis protein
MNSIIGFSELAQDDIIPGKTREYLESIQDSAEWLLKIINDILDISKIESGKIILEHIPFDLTDIFSTCQAAILPKAKEKGILLYCYAEPSLGKKLVGDPARLRQVITNLLSNAVKFTNIGTVKLLASIVTTSENHVTINFEVKDSGIGMTHEQIEKIFEPFMQADESVTRRFGGTGLGLSISKSLIEVMGGTLMVESTVGIGSKFDFVLTFEMIDDVADMPTREIIIDEFERPNFVGEVLVFEDNGLNQKVICDHLERVGLDTVVVSNGEEGVSIIEKRLLNKEKPFTLIFMDIHMPVMDGLEASSIITGLGVKTPIIALTANMMATDLELYRNSGVSDCLGKPFSTQELWRCLTKFIPVDSYTTIDKQRHAADEEKMLLRLKVNFVRNNQTTYYEIVKAMESGNSKLAHRIAHTLKSNAGQIGEKQLQTAAAAVEDMLEEKQTNIDVKEMWTLENELNIVLDELKPLIAEERIRTAKIEDPEKVWNIIERLESLLKNKNPECEDLLDDIRAIPGTETLALCIEKFKFRQALDELSKVKERTGMI